MPKAAKPHITTSAPATEAITGDPALVVAYQINRLWDAYNGADCEALDLNQKGETTDASVVRDQANQIVQWRDALETVLSYTRATSLTWRAFSDGYCRRRSRIPCCRTSNAGSARQNPIRRSIFQTWISKRVDA